MADRTILIELKAKVDSAVNGAKSVTSAFGGATGAASALSGQVAGLNNSLKGLAGIEAIRAFKKDTEDAVKPIEKLVKGFSGLGKVAKICGKIVTEFVMGPVREISNTIIVGMLSGITKGSTRITEILTRSMAQSKKYINIYLKNIEFMARVVKKRFTEFFEVVKKGLKSLIKGFLDLIPKIAGVAALLMVASSIKVAKVGDQIKDEAQKLNMSTTAYQEWGYVLEQNGVAISSLKTAMRTFNGELASNDKKLKKYGITATNTEEAFEQAIGTIQNMSSETEKLAALTDLFGSRATELLPVVNMNNQETQKLMRTYRALGGTMSNELISKSDQLTDSITALKVAFSGLKNTIGSILMPAITNIVKWLTVAIAKINILAKAIFGVGKNDTFGNAEKSSGGIAANISSAVSSAKKLKQLIGGFDELNIYQSPDAGGAADDMDIGSIDSGAFNLEFDDETLKKLEEFKNKVDKIAGALEPVKHILTVIGGGLLLAGLLKMLGMSTKASLKLGFALAGIVVFFIGFIDAIKNGVTFKNLGTMIVGLTATVIALGVAFGAVGAAVALLIGGFAMLIVGIIDWVKTGELSAQTATLIAVAIGAIGVAIALLTHSFIPVLIAAIAAGIVVIIKNWDKIKEFFKLLKEAFSDCRKIIKETFAEVGKWIWENITEFGNKIKAYFKLLKEAFSDCRKIFKETFAEVGKWIWENITEFGKWLGEKITSIFNTVTGIFKDFWKNTKESFGEIGNWIKRLWETVKQTFKQGVISIIAFLANLVANILTKWNEIKQTFRTLLIYVETTFKEGWKKAWEGVKTIFSNVFNGLKNIAKTPINWIIDAINKLIGGLNKIKLPNWDILGSLGGKGINIPLIPRLAKGGVLSTPTIAMMGEYAGARSNPEIVAPQNIIMELLSQNNGELISAFAQMTKQIVTAIEEQDTDVYIGDDAIARSAAKGNKAHKLQTGKSYF